MGFVHGNALGAIFAHHTVNDGSKLYGQQCQVLEDVGNQMCHQDSLPEEQPQNSDNNIAPVW
jgi:hypothetical protein